MFKKISDFEIVILGRRFSLDSHMEYVCLVLVWLAALLVAMPYGNFPVNDDWAYSKTVWNLVVGHELKLVDWYAMTFVTQLLYGALWCLVFGFSFTLLRISIILVGIFGTLLFYNMLKDLSNDKKLSFWIALVFAFNPLYFSLSCSFMTDIFFLVLMLCSFYFYMKALKDEKLVDFAIGTAFCVAATLTRQVGIFLPLSIMAVFFFRKPFSLKFILLMAGCFLVSAASIKGFELFFSARGNLPGMYGYGKGSSPFDILLNFDLLVENIQTKIGVALIYIGLFWFPLMFFFRFASLKIDRWVLMIIGVAVFLMSSARWMFPIPNIIHNLSIGARTLADADWSSCFFSLSEGWIHLILNLATIGAIFWILNLWTILQDIFKPQEDKSNEDLRRVRIAIMAFIGIFVGYFIISPYMFDRYVIPIVTFSFLLVSRNPARSPRWMQYIGVCFIAVIIGFSAIGTHDYFAEQRTRWDAIKFVGIKENATPRNTDGGFEYNGWNLYDFNYKVESGKSWWWVDDNKFVISYHNLPGYDTYKEFWFRSLLTLKKYNVKALKRKDHVDSTKQTSYSCDMETRSDDGSMFVSRQKNMVFYGGEGVSADDAFSGTHSLKLDQKFSFGLLSYLRNPSRENEYKISFMAKGDSVEQNMIFVIYFGEAYNQLKPAFKFESNGWKNYEIYLRYNMFGQSERFSFYLWYNGQKKIYIDDYQVTEYKP